MAAYGAAALSEATRLHGYRGDAVEVNHFQSQLR